MAAFMDWKLMVKSVMVIAATVDMINTPGPIVMR
jgi:hypothetical protein